MKAKVLFTLCLFSSLPLSAQTDEKYLELSKRIEQLERQQEELLLHSQGTNTQVNSFFRNNLRVGGFLETAILGVEGPDTDLQALNTSNVLGLNLSADFTNRWHLVTQFWTGTAFPLLNPNMSPGVNGGEREFGQLTIGSLLTQGYLEYTFSDHLRVQSGFGYVPFGYYFQQRDLFLFYRRGGPQLLRNSIVGQLWNGVHLLGEFSRPGGGELGYNLYTNNAFNPQETSQMGLGGRLWMSTADNSMTFGVSTQVGKYNNDVDEAIGADLFLKSGNYQLISEYARHFTEGDDAWSVFAEPGFFFADEQWFLFVFGDYAESSLNTIQGTSTPDPYNKWEYGIGVNWLPTSYTRFRLTYSMNDYLGRGADSNGKNRDFHSVDLSLGVAF